MGKAVLMALCLTALFTSLAYGHGVTYGVVPDRAVAVRFGYAGGEPMSYTEFKVFGPDSSPDLEFQNGRSDARGMVSFVPDKPGVWTVTAWDEMGHRGSLEVPVEDLKAGPSTPASRTPAGGPSAAKIALGLSLLANLALLGMVLRRRKRAA